MSGNSRRDFVRGGVLEGVSLGGTRAGAAGQAPAIITTSVRPVVIASCNGNRFKNGGNATCVEEAFRALLQGSPT